MGSERAATARGTRHSRLRVTAFRVAVVASLIASTVAIAAEPAGAATPWSVVPSPSPSRPSGVPLTSVSCATPTMCVAVGVRFDLNEDSPGIVIERWDGAAWSTVVQTATDATLNGVSCAGVKSCVAVGHSAKGKTLAQRWKAGGKWTTVATPNLGSVAELSGVDCATATNCFAVGWYRSGSKVLTLIEHWNGKSWKKVPSPNPSKATTARLNAVSCPSTTNCFAVGNHEEPGQQVGGVLVEHWNGKTWTAQTAPNPSYQRTIGLLVTPLFTSVSCPTPKVCLAAGYAANHSLVERWNGKKWSIIATPNLPSSKVAEFRAVSCASGNDCAAVGTAVLPIDEREGLQTRNSIAEHWNGKTWKIVRKPPGVPNNTSSYEVGQLAELNGVSCPAKANCAAVGNSALVERWNGRAWTLAPFATASSMSDSHLNAVSCPTPTTCLAIGTAAPTLGIGANVLAERWDGATWSVVPSATPAGNGNYAYPESLSCVGATDCTAVGRAGPPGLPLIERWNGTRWSLVASPSPAAQLIDAELHAVSCASASDCSAVGEYSAYVGKHQTSVTNGLLAEHWNGSVWSIVAIPGDATATLLGVSCSSATNCFAVGQGAEGTPLVDRWNGTQWTAVASPAPPSGTVYGLYDVTCVSDTDCTTVGLRASSTVAGTAPLVEHWNGAAWTVVPSPTPAGRDQSALYAVACASATSCAAVGTLDSFRNTGHGAPLIEEWNGASWSIAAAPAAAGSIAATLDGVAPLGTGYAAVGTSATARLGFHTLVQQRS